MSVLIISSYIPKPLRIPSTLSPNQPRRKNAIKKIILDRYSPSQKLTHGLTGPQLLEKLVTLSYSPRVEHTLVLIIDLRRGFSKEDGGDGLRNTPPSLHVSAHILRQKRLEGNSSLL